MLVYLFAVTGWLLTTIGLLVILIGSIGLWRLKDVFNKMHAVSLIDSFGLPLSLFGMALLQNNLTAFCKLILMMLLVFLLNPISTYALASAAATQKQFEKDEVKANGDGSMNE